MKSIAVFCGSSAGKGQNFLEMANDAGRILAERGITVVYGGASVGLMGAVADGAISRNGKVIGILPGALRNKEIAHQKLSKLIWCETMHERKSAMYGMSDAVISLPGGYGTLDETFEYLTWGQLGIHVKPAGLLNINGFWDPLLKMLDKMVKEGFLKQVNREMFLVSDSIEKLLILMEKYQPPSEGKWI